VVSKVESTSKELGKLEVRRIGILATATPATTTSEEASAGGGGFLGVKAKAYWKSMGFLPLFFAGFGIFALLVKMLKVVQGKWTSSDGVNRAMISESVITSKEQEADLHVFKCGGCGYEIYPARGREFKYKGDSHLLGATPGTLTKECKLILIFRNFSPIPYFPSYF